MGLDAIPSGFSSAAAIALLKTMRTTAENRVSVAATTASSSFHSSVKSIISGDTIFSIIAAAAQSKSATASARAVPAQSTNASVDAPSAKTGDEQGVGGAQALADDPYFTKSYTIDQAAQNWYAQMERLVTSMRATPGMTQPGKTDGQILAARSQWTGQQGADFAAKYDSRSLTFTDSTAVGVATNVRSWIMDGNGNAVGASTTGHVNGEAMAMWRQNNPNSVLIDDEGYRGGALLISW